MVPPTRNPITEMPGQFQWMASRKRWCVLLRTNRKMNMRTIGYAAACAPTTMRALVARSARGKRWYSGILRAIAKAMMLKRNTAKTVKDSTATTSQADQGGKRRGGGAEGTGSNGGIW